MFEAARSPLCKKEKDLITSVVRRAFLLRHWMAKGFGLGLRNNVTSRALR